MSAILRTENYEVHKNKEIPLLSNHFLREKVETRNFAAANIIAMYINQYAHVQQKCMSTAFKI